jgi:hypothetical protein
MTEIAVVVCAVSSLVASVLGGIHLLREEDKKAKEEERIADIEKQAEDSTKFVFYTECDYKGTPYETGNEGDVDKGTIEVSNPTLKSLIVPVGFTVDTYSKPGKTGVKMSFKGPTKMKCIDIPSLEWKRE